MLIKRLRKNVKLVGDISSILFRLRYFHLYQRNNYENFLEE